jgi:hypothetical protein
MAYIYGPGGQPIPIMGQVPVPMVPMQQPVPPQQQQQQQRAFQQPAMPPQQRMPEYMSEDKLQEKGTRKGCQKLVSKHAMSLNFIDYT